jgi:hypothetical protein
MVESKVVRCAAVGRGAVVDIVNEIPAQPRPGLETQRVNAAAIREFQHHVVDVIIGCQTADLGRGRRTKRLNLEVATERSADRLNFLLCLSAFAIGGYYSVSERSN